MLFFRAESILSWGEFTKVQRADDDSDDGNALEAARDMDVLSIAEDPNNANRLAARVHFDLDLPSAAADDVSWDMAIPLRSQWLRQAAGALG